MIDGGMCEVCRKRPGYIVHHIKNLTELVEMLEAEGLRDKVILACGGPRISHELAKELGYDAGFGMNTYADDVASFIAQEMARRMHRK